MKNIIITGGAGFIGSHVVRLFANKYPEYNIYVFDNLTYAGNLKNIKDVLEKPNCEFLKVDIADMDTVRKAINKVKPDGIVHLAAESHVDRSIKNPDIFIRTNINGTFNLLQCAMDYWNTLPEKFEGKKFYHISTDEVYGALDMNPEHKFTEETKYNPHSPYSASKASSDHLVRAFHDTFGLPTVISNCSNNYGPNQFPEKLIPLAINNLKNGKKIPVYGTGENVRDWLYVEDHAKAIGLIFHKGKNGETYNIGGNNEIKNIDIVRKIIDIVIGDTNDYDKYMEHIEDRKGHDLRYAIDSGKLQRELGWKPEESFDTAIIKTVKWYLDNTEWIEDVTSGEYMKYYDSMYGNKKQI